MKKLILSVIAFISISAYGQDSTKIQVSQQSRDIKYIASISSKDIEEDFFDAVKSKFRVIPANVPIGNTLVVVDSIYTADWVRIYTVLKNDPTALNAGVANRVETVLRAVNQTYLNGRLDAINANPMASFVTMQGVGLIKLKKQ